MKKLLRTLITIFLFAPLQAQSQEITPQNTIMVNVDDSSETIIRKAAHVVPTANQMEALKNEFIAFIHFGPNTYTRIEWGTGMEDPKVFDLKELNTDQWCQALKSAGIKMVIFTAKHHDGFVLWQSRYTNHGIMSTNFEAGKGDIMKDLSASCRKYGLKLGVYLSPADLYQIETPNGLYGNRSQYTLRTIPREVPGRPFTNKSKFKFMVDDYNEYFLNQLFELLTEYGTVHEVWFDGATPKSKGGQKYNYQAWRELIRTLAPEATIFGKEDIRWCGNEAGHTRNTEWNVITYKENPNTMNDYMDLHGDLGSREVLLNREKPYYLHYQPAETNTSIRDGWFYRDDIHQKTRSADDVFDIYERSVGGNSIFLLNVPPTRDGNFSPIDTEVLKETGKRIRETYGNNLFKNANGPKEVLDGNDNTFVVLGSNTKEVIVSVPQPITINRIVIQEAISTNSERVEKHALDAFVNGKWKEVALSTNIGYKRILRFPEVTTNKIRLRILESRLDPAICNISAHYFHQRPPMLITQRDIKGVVTIATKPNDFNQGNKNKTDTSLCKPEQMSKGDSNEYKIYYTTDGSEPNEKSTTYNGPFLMDNKELKAVAFLNGKEGAVLHERFGLIKQGWKVLNVSDELPKHTAALAIDENPETYWMCNESADSSYISIDLGRNETLNGFAYTPTKQHSEGMIEEGTFQISVDGKIWKDIENFKFGNLINDPTKRYHYFKKAVEARYIRILATKIAANGKAVSMAELNLF